MVKAVDIGTRVFVSKKSAHEFFQKELARRPSHSMIGQSDPFFEDIHGLLDRHPERERKVGAGVGAFQIMVDEMGVRFLWLHRIDGTGTDFSYVKCIRGFADSTYQRFLRAARVATDPDTDDFKRAYFGGSPYSQCQETFAIMSWIDAHVEHHPIPFRKIVAGFLQESGIAISEDLLSRPSDGSMSPAFACQKTREAFVEYHRKHAVLQVVHKQVNRTRSRKVQDAEIVQNDESTLTP
jgi:hypothetical protein